MNSIINYNQNNRKHHNATNYKCHDILTRSFNKFMLAIHFDSLLIHLQTTACVQIWLNESFHLLHMVETISFCFLCVLQCQFTCWVMEPSVDEETIDFGIGSATNYLT